MLLLTLVSSCFLYESHNIIFLDGYNGSEKDVWFSFMNSAHFKSNESKMRKFSDAGITTENYNEFFRYVEADTLKLIFIQRGFTWEDVFPDSVIIRVWYDHVIKEQGWDSFLKTNGYYSDLYEAEYILSIDDLQLLDYLITFPPSANLVQILSKKESAE